MIEGPTRIFLGSSDGMISGLLLLPASEHATGLLLVCIHGGGCNGGYFDLDNQSAAAMASARGLPVLLVNRPGSAGNAPLRSDRPLADTVPILRRFIDEVRAVHAGMREILLLGHSMGGAIALMLASGRGDWPLRAAAVSGIGDEPSEEVRDWRPEEPSQTVQPPLSAAALFFGPEGSYSWKAPLQLRRVNEPWLVADVMEMLEVWPHAWPKIAAAVDVPVHIRLAEHDRIWRTDPLTVARMAAALTAAPSVNAAVLADGGHLYEVHKRGPELIAAQLDFLLGMPSGQG